MERGLPQVPSRHPSTLALEAVLLGQATAEAARHASGCDACRQRLASMEHAGARYSPLPASLAARRALTRADRRWTQRASLASLFPLAALMVFVAWARQPAPLDVAPTIVASQLLRSVPRQGRELLEPRGGAPSPRLRQLAVRGRALEFGQGTLEAAAGDGPTLPFTLVHTKVDAAVSGLVSEVTITQTFENPFSQPVEALYVFPLPDDAAVHEMSLVAGGRVLRASVQRRAEARRQYETARAEGRRAALLDQERPNIFTQSVANLLPGERVEVRLTYVAPLHFDDGVFSFVFPMVVGPRFIPGAALPGESEGSGSAVDTDAVPDASRISPPVSRSGRDVEVSLRLEAGALLEDLWSVSHRLVVDRPTAQRATLSLDLQDSVPNKDLIVRWRVSGARERPALVAEGGAFALMLTPEPAGAHAPVTPKELVFLIDTSCSMNGAPLAAAKRAMGQALRRANDGDTFLLLDFAERARSFHPVPLPATSANVGRALSYLERLPAGGSTNQLAGIRAALDRPEDPSRLRLVLLMTDGFIGNEDEVLATTRTLRGTARVFGFGVGTSVNHFLLSRLSEEGRGFTQFIRPDEDSTEAVERFVRRIARPLVTDVTLDWGGLPVADVTPEAVPDLFDDQPLVVYGRYRGAADGTVVIRGRRAGVPVRYVLPVHLPEAHLGGRALATTWARQQVERLSSQARGGETPALVEAITALGLEHHLVTRFTSLVATEARVVTSARTRTVVEPTLPAPKTENKQPVEDLLQTGSLLPQLDPALGGDVGSALGGGGLGLRGTGGGAGGVGLPSSGPLTASSGDGLGTLGTGGGLRGANDARLGDLLGGQSGSGYGSGTGAIGTRGRGGGGLAGTGTSGGGALGPGNELRRAARVEGKESAGAVAAQGMLAVLGGKGTDPGPRDDADVRRAESGTLPLERPDAAPSARVSAEAATVRGAISREAVLRVVRAHAGDLQRCVERQRRLGPLAPGTLRLSWRVRADGTVLDVRVLSEAHRDLALGRCMTASVAKWTFPRATGEWAVTFPFVLQGAP